MTVTETYRADLRKGIAAGLRAAEAGGWKVVRIVPESPSGAGSMSHAGQQSSEKTGKEV
jgi:hypothetical protein